MGPQPLPSTENFVTQHEKLAKLPNVCKDGFKGINATKAKLGIIPANKQTKHCNKQVKEVHKKNPKTNKQTRNHTD